MNDAEGHDGKTVGGGDDDEGRRTDGQKGRARSESESESELPPASLQAAQNRPQDALSLKFPYSSSKLNSTMRFATSFMVG